MSDNVPGLLILPAVVLLLGATSFQTAVAVAVRTRGKVGTCPLQHLWAADFKSHKAVGTAMVVRTACGREGSTRRLLSEGYTLPLSLQESTAARTFCCLSLERKALKTFFDLQNQRDRKQ